MDETTISRLEQLLQDTLEVAEENNKILHSMQRTARWAFWGKLFVWILILVLPFLLLGPILHALVPIAASPSAGKTLFGLPSADQLQGLLEAYRQSSNTP